MPEGQSSWHPAVIEAECMTFFRFRNKSTIISQIKTELYNQAHFSDESQKTQRQGKQQISLMVMLVENIQKSHGLQRLAAKKLLFDSQLIILCFTLHGHEAMLRKIKSINADRVNSQK